MYLPDFDYYAPSTVAEVCTLLEELGPDARVLAGGTDLLIKMKNGVVAPSALISLKNISELRGVRYEAGRGVVIGATTSPSELMNSPVLHERFLSVSEAAHQMANNQVRNTGSIGGNLVNAIPSADLPPILIALNASLTLTSTITTRVVPVEEFFTGVSCCVLTGPEIVTEIVIPDQDTTGSCYMKMGLRRSGSLALVGSAVAVTMDGDTIVDSRVALGAVYPTPVRAPDAENIVRGKVWSEELLDEAGEGAACCSLPISDIRGSSEYRRDMVRVFTKRAYRRAITEGHC